MKKIVSASAIALSTSLLLANFALAQVSVPPPMPIDVDQCKNGGWQSYNGMFKNQGDCVSYVVTEGRNTPDGPNAN